MAQAPVTTGAPNDPAPPTVERQRHWSRHFWLGGVGFLVVGTVLAYCLARYATVETGLVLAPLLFLVGVGFLTYAVALSIRSSGPLPMTIASLFAVSMLALPLFGFAAMQGLASRAEAALGGLFGEIEGDLGGDSDDAFASAGSFGDDPEMDALWTSCEEGDMEACDDLYQATPFGSEYEEFGGTCGNRESMDGAGLCY
jgi:hypothetical protein